MHDLIPIEYPEYARIGGAGLHRRRMDTLARHASVLVTNSGATRDALAACFSHNSRVPLVRVAHLGVEAGHPGSAALVTEDPYFVCVGTIEPRKNHLLLLNLWRRMVEHRQEGQIIPKLILIGRRGWENENVIDMLERCEKIQEYVIEASRIPDGEIDNLISGARAMLLPSFAEGYGMPVAESLAMGVPVLCSDLVAHREVGADVPEYLDPLDAPGWLAAINEYALIDSTLRAGQLHRIQGWRKPRWEDHIKIVLEACEQAIR